MEIAPHQSAKQFPYHTEMHPEMFNETGQKSLKTVEVGSFTDTIGAVLNLVGTAAWGRDNLKMFVKTPSNCSSQAFSIHPGIP